MSKKCDPTDPLSNPLPPGITCPPTHTLISENSAHMIFPKENQIFYNRVQVLNRDLSVSVIRGFNELRVKEREVNNLRKVKRNEFTSKQADRNGQGSKDRNAMEEVWRTEAEEEVKDVNWTHFINDEDIVRKALAVKNLNKTLTPDDEAQLSNLPKGLKILDALAASGLRSIRYAKEIPNLQSVTINDMSTFAIEQAKSNIEFNKVDPNVVLVNEGDATAVMYNSRSLHVNDQFDVIDLDPYGSAAPFIDAAVQSISNGGLLCITSTDMAVLSGNHTDTCFSKYRSVPLNKSQYLHEMALRILLHTVETSANRYGRHVVPLLSAGIDFYIRIFVRVYDSPIEVKKSILKTGLVYQSNGCPSFHVQPSGYSKQDNKTFHPTVGLPGVDGKCSETGKEFKIGGPIWIAPIHEPSFVEMTKRRVEFLSGDSDYPGTSYMHEPLPTKVRLFGLLTSISEELNDSPLYYILPTLASSLSLPVPPRRLFIKAMEQAGYKVSSSHKEADAVKTNAPNSVVWDVMRNWAKHVEKNGKVLPSSGKGTKSQKGYQAQDLILAVEPAIVVSFDSDEGSASGDGTGRSGKKSSSSSSNSSSKTKAVRYPINPERNWGPMRAAPIKKRQLSEMEDAAVDEKKKE